MGVENEQMLLGNLSENSVDPPLEFTVRIPVDDSNFTIPVRGDAGCFIGGAGKKSPTKGTPGIVVTFKGH